MTDTNDGGPAFPHVWEETNQHGFRYPCILSGMSLRDWFAGQALAGLCADPDRGHYTPMTNAKAAYANADAMLAARSAKP